MNAIAQPTTDARRQAKFLYWTGWRITDIADFLGEKEKTVHSWKARDEWDRADNVERIGGALEARLVQLILKEGKTGGDFKEIDLLHRQLERQARIQRYQGGGTETDLNPNIAKRNEGPKKQAVRNELDEQQIETLVEAFRDSCFDYQLDWYRAGNQRTRMVLKSRQIGATFYFAREALIDAITTGRNQIFLSASKAQAHQFKTYMQAFLNEVLGVKLTGDPIVLWNNAELHFLGTNFRTAQGRSGNFYFDEFFWVHGFKEINKVASGMGAAVAQLVRQFFPGLRTFSYSPEVKTRLVMKAVDVISKGRLEFDAGWTDVAQSLMAIRKTITAGGRQFTYTAGRNETTGHADLAWALFHALQNEPLEGQTTANTGFMEIYS
ncbi:MAG: hypothetical protein E2581_22130 [Pseudomonas sp.]|uniref:terminase large subunit domain-containing protein n=1 Tax=Pseudomonas sp. TaxID=306 RepID=UPI001D52E336|nr:terminase family protein [Pseudomonas sp.]MPT01170.1 hypothetical protein [Pseudomonas sp.]